MKYYEKLFPSLLNNLRPNLINSSLILDILATAIQKGRIPNEQLITFLSILEDFYSYTKLKRDELPGKDEYLLNGYYWIVSPILARCLAPVYNHPVANRMLSDMYTYSTAADTRDKLEVSWEACKALQKISGQETYFSKIAADVVYRKKLYRYLQDLSALHYFPPGYNNQVALSEMLAVTDRNLRIHDTDWPASISYAGTKEMNGEHLYFYLICWWQNCASNSLVVVGPQSSDKSKFDQNPRLHGISVKDNIDKTQINTLITNFNPPE